jgi:hypothetical protein
MRPSGNPISFKDLPSAKGNLRFLSTLFAQPGVEIQQKTKDTPRAPSPAAVSLSYGDCSER